MLELSIRRHGQFHVAWSGDNQNQCGRSGTSILTYDVNIIGDEEHLTEQGFIIDNFEIQEFFEQRFGNVVNFPSCEHIAMQAARGLASKFGPDGVPHLMKVVVHEVSVTIGNGMPGIGITARWRNPGSRTHDGMCCR